LFFEIDGQLYFAKDSGEIFRFEINDAVSYEEIESTSGTKYRIPSYDRKYKYTDKSRTFIGVGGALLNINETSDTLVVSSDYADKVKEGNPFHVITNYIVSGVDNKSLIHASLGTFVYDDYRKNMVIGGGSFDATLYAGVIVYDSTNNDYYIEIKPYKDNGTEIDQDRLNTIKNYFYDGRKVYLDNANGSNTGNAVINEEYRLVKVSDDPLDNRYYLYDSNNEKALLEGLNTVRISFVINDLAITKITNISDYGSSGAKQFKLIGDHDQVLDLIKYNNTNYTYAGVITEEDNVRAYYETAPYAMGSVVNLKTIWSWTIVNDTNLAGYIDVGYFASRKQGDYSYSIRSVPNSFGFDFSRYSFHTVEFLSRKLPATYSVQRTVPSVAYIRYLFKNFEESNIVLTTLNVVYTISNLLKGVK